MDNNAIENAASDGEEANGPFLTADNILASEYEYITQTAFQANEDRARVSTYYIVTFGTLVAAMISLQIDNTALLNLHIALVIVFLTLSFFGLLTLLQLVRLRQAWTESVLALDQIKRFYQDQLPQVPLVEAFRWTTKTIPTPYKPWSMAFVLASQVALLGGVSLGAAVYFLGLVLAGTTWSMPILSGIAYTVVQIWLYRFLLKN